MHSTKYFSRYLEIQFQQLTGDQIAQDSDLRKIQEAVKTHQV